MITVEEVTKIFRGNPRPALDCVSLSIDEGSLCGLVGPNGAGKSTLIRLIAGLLVPSSGFVRIRGMDIAQHRQAVLALLGYVPERLAFYPYLSGGSNVELLWDLAGRPRGQAKIRSRQVLETVGLGQVADSPAGSYSYGMLRRLMLAQALVLEPKVLLLDEPFGGLDLRATRFLRSFLREFHSDGNTIVLASHMLTEIDGLCGRTALLARGKLVRYERIEDIRASLVGKYNPQFRITLREMSPDIMDIVEGLPYLKEVGKGPGFLLVTLKEGRGDLDLLLESLASAGEQVLSVEPEESMLATAIYESLNGVEDNL